MNFLHKTRLIRTIRTRSNHSLASNDAVKPLLENLQSQDSEIYDIIEREKERQASSVNLIPSENFTSRAVMDALGSVMQNKYSEGYPKQRYYGGNEFIDMAEMLCQKRALDTFKLCPDEWGVNVQPLSGAPANLYAYSAVMKPHDRLMGLDLPHGGHLSHGYQTPTKKISNVSVYFETMPYQCDIRTGTIDYDALEKSARLFRPKVIVAGASAYSRKIDYARMRQICDGVGAYLLADIAHVGGLMAADVLPSPFPHADIVTTTTHKSLRGPRGAMIFFRKGVRSVSKKSEKIMYNLESNINFSVFPGHQGGPHNHTISALAVALKQAQSPQFKEYQLQVLKNAKRMEETFKKLGYSLVSGGTDTHLLLIDLREKNIDGARVERVLELVNIAANKNTVPGDKSALVPGGLRVGTPAMTTRGLVEADFERICQFVHEGVQLAILFNSKMLEQKKGRFKDFKEALGESGEGLGRDIATLKAKVVDFCGQFPRIA